MVCVGLCFVLCAAYQNIKPAESLPAPPPPTATGAADASADGKKAAAAAAAAYPADPIALSLFKVHDAWSKLLVTVRAAELKVIESESAFCHAFAEQSLRLEGEAKAAALDTRYRKFAAAGGSGGSAIGGSSKDLTEAMRDVLYVSIAIRNNKKEGFGQSVLVDRFLAALHEPMSRVSWHLVWETLTDLMADPKKTVQAQNEAVWNHVRVFAITIDRVFNLLEASIQERERAAAAAQARDGGGSGSGGEKAGAGNTGMAQVIQSRAEPMSLGLRSKLRAAVSKAHVLHASHIAISETSTAVSRWSTAEPPFISPNTLALVDAVREERNELAENIASFMVGKFNPEQKLHRFIARKLTEYVLDETKAISHYQLSQIQLRMSDRSAAAAPVFPDELKDRSAEHALSTALNRFSKTERDISTARDELSERRRQSELIHSGLVMLQHFNGMYRFRQFIDPTGGKAIPDPVANRSSDDARRAGMYCVCARISRSAPD